MIHIFLNKLRKILINYTKSEQSSEPSLEKDDDIATDVDLASNLSSACTVFTMYMREDGEFAVTTSMTRATDEAIEVTGTVLHMMNSGLLAEYFLQSLYLWSKEHPEYQSTILDTIAKWKLLFDDEQNDDSKDSSLAIDPSEVFSLKSLSEGDFK